MSSRRPLVRVLFGLRGAALTAGLTALLDNEDGVEVVGAASTSEHLFSAIRRHTPDVVLLDDSLVEFVADVSPTPVLLLASAVSPDAYLAHLAASGAQGLAFADSPLAELTAALRAIAAGGRWVAPELGGQLLALATHKSTTSARPETPLREKERDALPLIADGLTDQDIATKLHLSLSGAKYHVVNLMSRFQARNRAHLVALAFRSGLLPR